MQALSKLTLYEIVSKLKISLSENDKSKIIRKVKIIKSKENHFEEKALFEAAINDYKTNRGAKINIARK